ncbi:non-ribosomal peptide synthetase module [Fusibacter paucivorans]|uniref:Non-ribosomal peptide synthetase module n=1 Tax=Fusibacter paucivorans TaxID=76009 RepID=A0ABS5PSI3_9FIRM|nr:DUF6063 family protein [Fusibacter paucivorans]MBS7528118.1 non-ribosomal peptide synthetase module [Fusibacter paucivorans]MDK2868598.1 hypothetical protein [Clostridiales bacterium]
MNYNLQQIQQAFRIYAELSVRGELLIAESEAYIYDDHIRGLVDTFASEMNAAVLVTSEYLLLLPLSMASPFHIANDALKRDYLPSKAQNSDIYLLYFSMIIFYGLFYDSYQTTDPIRDFVTYDIWLEAISEAIETLASLDEAYVTYIQKDMQYNWKAIIDKWQTLDDTNEKVKNQDLRTLSRLSFLNGVIKFMDDQHLIIHYGNQEIGISDKSMDIVTRYYMDSEYNRGILEIIYGDEKSEVNEVYHGVNL